MREVERGDDRRAKDSSRTREDNRVCAFLSVSQREGSPVVSGSSARFAFAVFVSLFRFK